MCADRRAVAAHRCLHSLPVSRRPAPYIVVAGVVAWLGALLAADRYVSQSWQLALGGATLAVLAAVCVPLRAERRAQVAVVVAVATCFEVLGSIVWGVYHYRYGNLPVFVPPAHGLVYLGGLALSRTRLFAGRPGGPQLLVRLALAGAVGWGVVGLTGVLGRHDAVGAFGVLVFACFVLSRHNRAPQVLAGVFFVVAALEMYGTAIGTWRWEATVPGLRLPDGNPPSGAVSGYVIFDLAAWWAAPALLALVRRPLSRRRAA